MKIFFLIPVLLGFFSPVKAEVDSKVAEFCLRAKDFEGCVRSMSSQSSDMPSMRIIEGGVELSGNSCPEGFAYAGAGKCRDVSRRVSDILKVMVLDGGLRVLPVVQIGLDGRDSVR